MKGEAILVKNVARNVVPDKACKARVQIGFRGYLGNKGLQQL